MTSRRRSVEQTTMRVVLLVWVSITVLIAISGQRDGRLAARTVAVLVVATVTVEGARWLRVTTGPPARPLAPLVRAVRPEPSTVPARLQSWVGLLRAAEGDPHVGPLLRDRLADLARARHPGSPASEAIAGSIGPDVRLDAARLAATIEAIEQLP
jgi:hypothetical protein